MYRFATVAELEAEAAKVQAKVGDVFQINPNSYGIRAECTSCHESATHDRAYRFIANHAC